MVHMVRLRRFSDTEDVLDAARRRLDHTLLTCDRIVVAFSGGKDSLACLHLVREAQQRVGDDRPVLAVFRDLEYVNHDVLEKVDQVHSYPWVDLRWWCIRHRMKSAIMSGTRNLTTWDRNREWHHTPPEYAERLPNLMDVAAIDAHMVTVAPGKVVVVTGLRSAESLMRYRSVVNKLHEPHLAAGKAPGVIIGRPIYDWQENDVLRYLLEVGEHPSVIYDAQAWAGQGQLRTASLLASEQMRDLEMLAVTDPAAYDALLGLYPEVATARRYSRDLRNLAAMLVKTEAETLEEVEDWCYATFEGGALAVALDRLEFATGLHRKNPHGFPAWWVQHEIARAGHGTGMMPLPKHHPRYKERL